MRVLGMSDLHGYHEVYHAIPDLVRRHAVEAVILAGDLLGEPEGYDTIESAQRADAAVLVEILRRLPVPVLYIMGNDDMVELDPGSDHIQSLHGRRIDLGSYNFVGYQYSLPFMGGIFEKPEAEIAADMAELEGLLDTRSVLVTHSPAQGILDTGVLGISAGSSAILAAVLQRSVRAHLHGHIHSRFGCEGRHFNVAGGGKLRGLVIDLATLRHEVIDSGSPWKDR